MTNEKKAEEIALKYAREYLVSKNNSHKQNILFKESSIIECEKAALEMAKWKDEADVAEASDLNYKMQLALYDKLGNALWDTKKYLYLMNCIYGLSNSKTYEIKK